MQSDNTKSRLWLAVRGMLPWLLLLLVGCASALLRFLSIEGEERLPPEGALIVNLAIIAVAGVVGFVVGALIAGAPARSDNAQAHHQRKPWWLLWVLCGWFAFVAMMYWSLFQQTAVVLLCSSVPVVIMLWEGRRLMPPSWSGRTAVLVIAAVALIGLQFLWTSYHYREPIADRIRCSPFDVWVIVVLSALQMYVIYRRGVDDAAASREVSVMGLFMPATVGVMWLALRIIDAQWPLMGASSALAATPDYPLLLDDVIIIVSTLMVGAATRLTVWETANLTNLHATPTDEQTTTSTPLIDVQWQRVMADERRWLWRRRNRQSGHDRPAAEDPKPVAEVPGTVGMALSGGGIRSATLSLGFLHGLAKHSEGLLDKIDYLSTVSGGGWTGGAWTARVQSAATLAEVFQPNAADSWAKLTDKLRGRGDYLAPGGLGLNALTFRIAVAVLWGAVARLVAFVALAYALLVLLYESSSSGRVVSTIIEMLRPYCGWVFFPTTSDKVPLQRLADHLSALNGLGVLFVMAGIVLALALLVVGWGYIYSERVAHGATMKMAGGAAFSCAVLAVPLLALHGHWALTMLLIVAATLLIVVVIVRTLTLNQIKMIAGGLFATQGLAIFGPVREQLRAITEWTHGHLVSLLLYPGESLSWLGETFGRQALEPRYAAAVATVVFVLAGFGFSPNHAGMHPFWRAQIRAAYLLPEQTKGRDGEAGGWRVLARALQAIGRILRAWFALKFGAAATLRTASLPAQAADRPLSLLQQPDKGPLHIINGAVNTLGSSNKKRAQRGTERLEMTPLFVGGPATGWATSEHYHELTLARALAISAAAVNSQGGHTIPRAARPLIGTLNLGLGVWMHNPRIPFGDMRWRPSPHFWPWALFNDLVGRNSEDDTMIFASDGGHHDNLALTGLVARSCELVLCIDGGADPKYTCADLTRAIGLLVIDEDRSFAWLEGYELEKLRPEDVDGSYSERQLAPPYAIGRFTGGEKDTLVIYVKPACVDDLPVHVQAYAEQNPRFPQQTTADQFFDEQQFEAYRALGEKLGELVASKIEEDEHCRKILARRDTAAG